MTQKMRLLNLLAVCLACAVLSSPHGSLFAMADCIYYTVVSGDTCYDIAEAHLIDEPVFEGWNPGIICSNLQIGQQVCVTDPNAPPSPPGPCKSHTVEEGESCWFIWTTYGLTREEFRSYNPGIDCKTLQIGQEVCVSSRSSSPPPPPSPPSPPPPPPSDYNGNVFMEYIGANWVGVQFTDVPINSAVDFYFILSFAIDYKNSVPVNGDFQAYWQNTILTPNAVKAIKAQHSNVKVMLSLGGDSVYSPSGQIPVVFTPTSTSSWVSNAVSSLTSLINQYDLDGIDIDYEHFAATSDIFSDCIGQLITQLKQNNVISVATIAPFDGVESYYVELFNKYSSVIDYVNFQFYTYNNLTESQYESYYDTAASKYGGGSKVLASFNTHPGTGTSPPIVLSACKQLQARGKLPGIFVWSADNSKSAHTFMYEEGAQSLLASSSSQLSFVS